VVKASQRAQTAAAAAAASQTQLACLQPACSCNLRPQQIRTMSGAHCCRQCRQAAAVFALQETAHNVGHRLLHDQPLSNHAPGGATYYYLK
jgi:hypothetical protein